ncbi:MAG TPA: hypothetical protein VM285_02100 [Polyangia bacterium]|nr:hypothetical protein [Polyangia bacterium]
MRARSAVIHCFESLEQENDAERERLARMTPEQRLAEVAALKERVFGPGWTKKPIEKIWSFETVDWL